MPDLNDDDTNTPKPLASAADSPSMSDAFISAGDRPDLLHQMAEEPIRDFEEVIQEEDGSLPQVRGIFKDPIDKGEKEDIDKMAKESKEAQDKGKDSKDSKEDKEGKESKDSKEGKEDKEGKDSKDGKEGKEIPHETQELRLWTENRDNPIDPGPEDTLL